jgi:Spy/CpxP family protein refolding chaperone
MVTKVNTATLVTMVANATTSLVTMVRKVTSHKAKHNFGHHGNKGEHSNFGYHGGKGNN